MRKNYHKSDGISSVFMMIIMSSYIAVIYCQSINWLYILHSRNNWEKTYKLQKRL